MTSWEIDTPRKKAKEGNIYNSKKEVVLLIVYLDFDFTLKTYVIYDRVLK